MTKALITPCRPDARYLSVGSRHAQEALGQQFRAFGGEITRYSDDYHDFSMVRWHSELWSRRAFVAVETITLNPEFFVIQHEMQFMQVKNPGPASSIEAFDKLIITHESGCAILSLDSQARHPLVVGIDDLQPGSSLYGVNPNPKFPRERLVYQEASLVPYRAPTMPMANIKPYLSAGALI